MRLSEHFNLHEFEFSEIAARNGWENTPAPDCTPRLIDLCDHILEPVWEHFGPVHSTSGYRCLKLNRALGSLDTSQHVMCEADDFVVATASPLEVCNWIVKNLKFDQCIHEFGRWTHVSYSTRHALRNEALTIFKENGKTKTIRGIAEV